MSRTLLLAAAADEAVHAPEFRYLRSWVRLQARRAFGEIVGGPAADLDAVDRVLLLAGERVLITARSLEALGRALRHGADAAVPRPLSALAGAAGGAVHTLRGYERLEEALLAAPGGLPDTAPTARLPPVALLTRGGFETLLAGRTPAELLAALADPAGGLPPPAGLRLATAGTFHEFIDYYGEVRSDVLPHVPPGTRRILEIGCGRGVTGELLRRELGARVTGVELNPVVAKQAAARLDRVISGDIEDPALAPRLAEDAPYDLVLATELFEHLAYPESFLERARDLLRPGGVILLSTPNVGHYSVVEDLLAGRWDYLPIGLLCYTHLRFFTRRTLEDWLERLGFEHFRILAQETEESPHVEALARAVEVDRASLRTKGFWVVIERS